MEKLFDQLQVLGLNDKQARSYVALVELGQATAYQIAQKAKLKRPITYIVLDELRRKGLVLKVPYAKKQLFIAKAPDELFAEAEEKLRYAKRALPELLGMVTKNSRSVRVLYFEGKEGIREALKYKIDSLQNKELLAFYGKTRASGDSIPKTYADYNRTLFEQDTVVRGFAPLHKSLKQFRAMDKKYDWSVIPLKETDFSAEVTLEIADNFVRILLYKDSQAVIIENPDLAKTMREIFEMVWKAKK